MRVLIVGFGSIGRRHCANLRRLGLGTVEVKAHLAELEMELLKPNAL